MTATNGYPQYAVDLMEGQARIEAEIAGMKQRLDSLGCLRHDERLRILETANSKIGERTGIIATLSVLIGGGLTALLSWLWRRPG